MGISCAACSGVTASRSNLEAVESHIDRSQLARQLAEEQRQRRRLADFLRQFDGSGGP
ncbi:hypothetical protein [Streptomyces sp. 8N706]|uniref:hypothetical protein n=1 Tax=Streptomyces sp. 8N706 TaxID=3457416 RepID=UPI003FCFC5A0